MVFAQVVVGPPGSGKTTYCDGMRDILKSIGRNAVIVNLDPANENIPYECDIDVRDLISIEDCFDQLELGPNGGLIYCMEFLEKNVDWLEERLDPYEKEGAYIVFDCPGQVELMTHNMSLKNILNKLVKERDYRLCAVHLVDSHYCSDPTKFISVLLVSLTTMLCLELPHVNVLSKIDLVEKFGKLAYNLDFYADVLDLSYLLEHLQKDEYSDRYRKLNSALCEVVEDFGLVSFLTLNIEDKESVVTVLRNVDKANGYVFGGQEQGNESIMNVAAGEVDWMFEGHHATQEKYFDDDADAE